MQVAIKSHGVEISDRARSMVERKFRFALTRFSPQLRRVAVKLTDANRPCGGNDKVCSVTLKFKDGRDARAVARADRFATAAAAVAERAARVASRMIERDRTARHRSRSAP